MFLKAFGLARSIESIAAHHRESIATQSWARLQALATVFQREKAWKLEDNGDISSGGDRYPCGISNRKEFTALLTANQLLPWSTMQISPPHLAHTHYRYEGWGIWYPPRCNVKFAPDWAGKIVVDLGRVQA